MMKEDISLFPEKAKIGVAIFAMNDENTVPSLVHMARAYTKNVIVIDDGSTDETRTVARMANAELNKKRNTIGRGFSIKEAFRWAFGNDLDVLVTMDGSGKHDPGLIPFLIEPIVRGNADLVIGSKGFTYEGKSRKSLSWRIGKWMIKRSRGASPIYDRKSGFRAYSSKTFGKFKFSSNGPEQQDIMLDQADEKKLRVHEIPMKAIYGYLDKQDIGLGNHLIRSISTFLYTFHIKTPLRLSIFISSFLIFLASGAAIYSKVNYPHYELLPPGGIFVVMTLIVLAGFVILNGLIFEAISHVGTNIISYLQKNDQIKLEYDPLKGYQR